MKKYLFIFLTILCITSLGASAQSKNPVRWRTTVKMTSANEGVVTIKALVGEGWHLYGTSLPKGGPKATVFDFSASTGVKFIGDLTPSTKPVTALDKMFNLKLSYWASNVSFTRKFRVIDAAKASIAGKITYMACNGSTCMPPKTESVKVAVPANK